MRYPIGIKLEVKTTFVTNKVKMADKVDKDKFYNDLEQKLKDYHKFPSTYIFKFIVPNDLQSLAEVEALFSDKAVVTTRESKTGKYISLTGKEIILQSSEVISVYKNAEKIEGLISL